MAQFTLRNAQIYAAQTVPGQMTLRNAQIYAAVVSPPTLEVRNATAYALASQPPAATLRNVTAYALYTPSSLAYLRMKGATALLTAINKEHSKTITTDQVSFGDPEVLTGNQYNTRVAMIAKPTYSYSGQMLFRYDRFKIADLFVDQQLDLPAGNQTTIHARLPAVNAAFNCNLEARDIVDGPVAANATSITLTVAATSHLFLPGTQITFAVAVPSNDLSALASQTALDGFDVEG